MPVILNIPCQITKRGKTDIYGQELPGETFPEKCQIVKLEPRVQHSTVRTDASASRGRAMEDRGEAVILVSARSIVALEDVLIVAGVSLRVMEKRARYRVTGVLDHFQLTCESE